MHERDMHDLPRMALTSVRVPQDLLDRVNASAARLNRTASWFKRVAFERFCNDVETGRFKIQEHVDQT